MILTAAGLAYASAITKVIARLNRTLAAKVTPEQLVAADAVLRMSIEDDRAALSAERIRPASNAAQA